MQASTTFSGPGARGSGSSWHAAIHPSVPVRPRPAPRRACQAAASASWWNKLTASVNKGERLHTINGVYGSPITREKLQHFLSDDFQLRYEGGTGRTFGKADYIRQMCDVTLPAIPDFNWTHACSGDLDDEGWAIVTVQATGHHTGQPLVMPGLEPVPPSGKHFALAPELERVKVAGGKVTAIEVLPSKGAGPRALYTALGGKLPQAAAAAGPSSGTDAAAGNSMPLP